MQQKEENCNKSSTSQKRKKRSPSKAQRKKRHKTKEHEEEIAGFDTLTQIASQKHLMKKPIILTWMNILSHPEMELRRQD